MNIRHVALDLDGTVYRDGKLLDCTKPFLQTLSERGIGHSFLTNNTSLSRADYVLKLRKLGLDAGIKNVCTPAASTMAHLKTLNAKKVALLGTPSLAKEFEEAGFSVDWDAPDAVVVAFDMSLTYERLCKTAYWIAKVLPFIATHPDKVCPTDQPTVLVDCGSITACLVAATGKTPKVFGKPDPSMLLDLCQRLAISPADMAMVGDRIYTDMAMARAAGAIGVLVLSGEATAEDAAKAVPPPDLIVKDLGEFGRLL